MRGYRIPKDSRKIDVVIVAARFAEGSTQLECGQAYVRRGPIWGDLILLSRDDILQRLKEKQRIVTGTPSDIPGEFVIYHPVNLKSFNGSVALQAGESSAKGDDLSLPYF